MVDHENLAGQARRRSARKRPGVLRVVTDLLPGLPADWRLAYGRSLSAWHEDLYTLAEMKEILIALERLRNAEATGPDWANKAALREASDNIFSAAYSLASTMRMRINDLLAFPDTAGARSLSKQVDSLIHPFVCGTDPDDIPTTRHRLRTAWDLLGSSQTPLWRGMLKDLRAGKLSLREALRRHPALRNALRFGVLESGMSQQIGHRWLHHLEASDTSLKEVIDTALAHKDLMKKRGRRAYPELVDFTEALIAVGESYSGKKVTASDHWDTRIRTDLNTRTTSAGVHLVSACVSPLYPAATLESCGRLIRQVRQRQRDKTK